MRLIKVEKVDENLFEEIVKRILQVVTPIKIVVFGSYAYGKPHKSSDLDLLVIMDNNIVSRHKVAAEIYGALRGILIPKDVIVAKLADIEEWENVPQAFITKIVKKGKVIYER